MLRPDARKVAGPSSGTGLLDPAACVGVALPAALGSATGWINPGVGDVPCDPAGEAAGVGDWAPALVPLELDRLGLVVVVGAFVVAPVPVPPGPLTTSGGGDEDGPLVGGGGGIGASILAPSAAAASRSFELPSF